MSVAVIVLAFGRAIGRVAYLLSYGVIIGTVIFGLVLPANPQAAWADGLEHRSALLHTLQASAGATVLALLLGTFLAAGYSVSSSRIVRHLMLAAGIFATLTMPSVYGYAALLVGANDLPLISGLDLLIRTGNPWIRRVAAAAVLSWWLWPVPFFLLVAGLRSRGHTFLAIALQDARGWRAWCFGLWPILRGPFFTAAAIVFVLATTEATIAPLFVPQESLWAPEMMAQAALARGDLVDSLRPNAMGYLLRQAWPLLILQLGLLMAAAWYAWRCFGDDYESQADRDVMSEGRATRSTGSPRGASLLGEIAMAALVGVPLIVFVRLLLNDQRYTAIGAFTSVWQTAVGPLISSLWVAGLVFLLSVALALAGMQTSEIAGTSTARQGKLRWRRIGSISLCAAAILCATLPTSVIATGITQFFGGGPWGDPRGWNIYDDTPVAWIAAMLVRFAFIPIVVGTWFARSAPNDLIQAAYLDGANELQAWLVGRWPFVGKPILIGAAFAAALALVEAPTSLLTAPARWGHGSLAAYVDQLMHYERHGQTLALTLLLYGPATLFMLAWLLVKLTRSGYHTRMR